MSARPVSTSSTRPRRGAGAQTSFTSSSRTRSADTIVIRSRIACMAATTSGATLNPSCATKRAARSIRSGSSAKDASGVPGVRSTPAARSRMPPNGSTKSPSGRAIAIALTVKSRRSRSRLEVVSERHLRLAGGGRVGVGSVGRDLDLGVAEARPDGAEVAPHVPHRVGPPAEHGLDRLGPRRGGEVQVVRRSLEQQVAHRTHRPAPGCGPHPRTAAPARSRPGARRAAPRR